MNTVLAQCPKSGRYFLVQAVDPATVTSQRDHCVVAKETATDWGLESLTTPYKLPDERWMLENTVSDMRKKRTKHAVVRVNGGVEVWRKDILRDRKKNNKQPL